MYKPSNSTPKHPADNAQDWSDVSAEWRSTKRDGLWRMYSDRLTSDLIASWCPDNLTRVLKTDLFDEAVSQGLFPVLAARAERVHGVDLAQDAVTAARDKYPALDAHVADIRALPFDASTFDAVVSTSTLDHFDDESDIHRALAEIRRVIQPGGLLLATLDNPLNPKLALRSRISESLLMRTGLMPYSCGVTLSPDAFELAMRGAGFEVLKREAFLHCPRVTAVKLAALIRRTGNRQLELGFLDFLQRFERLDALPTRWRTAHFTAILARAI